MDTLQNFVKKNIAEDEICLLISFTYSKQQHFSGHVLPVRFILYSVDFILHFYAPGYQWARDSIAFSLFKFFCLQF